MCPTPSSRAGGGDFYPFLLQAMLQEMRHTALNKVLVNWKAHGPVLDMTHRRQEVTLAATEAVAKERLRIENLPPGTEKDAAWLRFEEVERRAEARTEAAALAEGRLRAQVLPQGTAERRAAEERVLEHEIKAHAALAVADLDVERHRCSRSPPLLLHLRCVTHLRVPPSLRDTQTDPFKTAEMGSDGFAPQDRGDAGLTCQGGRPC